MCHAPASHLTRGIALCCCLFRPRQFGEAGLVFAPKLTDVYYRPGMSPWGKSANPSAAEVGIYALHLDQGSGQSSYPGFDQQKNLRPQVPARQKAVRPRHRKENNLPALGWKSKPTESQVAPPGSPGEAGLPRKDGLLLFLLPQHNPSSTTGTVS